MTDAQLRARAEMIWTIVQAQACAAGSKGALLLKGDRALEQLCEASFVNGYLAGMKEVEAALKELAREALHNKPKGV